MASVRLNRFTVNESQACECASEGSVLHKAQGGATCCRKGREGDCPTLFRPAGEKRAPDDVKKGSNVTLGAVHGQTKYRLGRGVPSAMAGPFGPWV